MGESLVISFGVSVLRTSTLYTPPSSTAPRSETFCTSSLTLNPNGLSTSIFVNEVIFYSFTPSIWMNLNNTLISCFTIFLVAKSILKSNASMCILLFRNYWPFSLNSSSSHCVKFVLFCNNSSTFKARAILDNLLCVERTLQPNKHETEDTNNINQGW